GDAGLGGLRIQSGSEPPPGPRRPSPQAPPGATTAQATCLSRTQSRLPNRAGIHDFVMAITAGKAFVWHRPAVDGVTVGGPQWNALSDGKTSSATGNDCLKRKMPPSAS